MRSALRLFAWGCLAVVVAAMADGASAGVHRSVVLTVGYNNEGPTVFRSIFDSNNGTTTAANSSSSGGFSLPQTSISLSTLQSARETGLAWGDPLTTDLVNLGLVHARLHYFRPSNGFDTQQAVGIKFSIQY